MYDNRHDIKKELDSINNKPFGYTPLKLEEVKECASMDYKREYEVLRLQALKDIETIDNLKQTIKLLSKAL